MRVVETAGVVVVVVGREMPTQVAVPPVQRGELGDLKVEETGQMGGATMGWVTVVLLRVARVVGHSGHPADPTAAATAHMERSSCATKGRPPKSPEDQR